MATCKLIAAQGNLFRRIHSFAFVRSLRFPRELADPILGEPFCKAMRAHASSPPGQAARTLSLPHNLFLSRRRRRRLDPLAAADDASRLGVLGACAAAVAELLCAMDAPGAPFGSAWGPSGRPRPPLATSAPGLAASVCSHLHNGADALSRRHENSCIAKRRRAEGRARVQACGTGLCYLACSGVPVRPQHEALWGGSFKRG